MRPSQIQGYGVGGPPGGQQQQQSTLHYVQGSRGGPQPNMMTPHQRLAQQQQIIQHNYKYYPSLSGSETDVSTSTENLTQEERYVLRNMERQEPQGEETQHPVSQHHTYQHYQHVPAGPTYHPPPPYTDRLTPHQLVANNVHREGLRLEAAIQNSRQGTPVVNSPAGLHHAFRGEELYSNLRGGSQGSPASRLGLMASNQPTNHPAYHIVNTSGSQEPSLSRLAPSVYSHPSVSDPVLKSTKSFYHDPTVLMPKKGFSVSSSGAYFDSAATSMGGGVSPGHNIAATSAGSSTSDLQAQHDIIAQLTREMKLNGGLSGLGGGGNLSGGSDVESSGSTSTLNNPAATAERIAALALQAKLANVGASPASGVSAVMAAGPSSALGGSQSGISVASSSSATGGSAGPGPATSTVNSHSNIPVPVARNVAAKNSFGGANNPGPLSGSRSGESSPRKVLSVPRPASASIVSSSTGNLYSAVHGAPGASVGVSSSGLSANSNEGHIMASGGMAAALLLDSLGSMGGSPSKGQLGGLNSDQQKSSLNQPESSRVTGVGSLAGSGQQQLGGQSGQQLLTHQRLEEEIEKMRSGLLGIGGLKPDNLPLMLGSRAAGGVSNASADTAAGGADQPTIGANSSLTGGGLGVGNVGATGADGIQQPASGRHTPSNSRLSNQHNPATLCSPEGGPQYSQEMIDIVMTENRDLKVEVETLKRKIQRLDMLEKEMVKIHEAYTALREHSDKRELLEKSARAKLQSEILNLQEVNKELRERHEAVMAQIMSGDTSNIPGLDTILRSEILRKDSLISQLHNQNRDLLSTKERLDIETSAQRETLQEQRTHIDVLDAALSNAQNTVLRLEEEVRQKDAYAERVKQMTKSLEQLQAASEKREAMEKKLRAKLEEELKELKARSDGGGGGEGVNGEEGEGGLLHQGAAQGQPSPDHEREQLNKRLSEAEEKIIRLESERTQWEQRYLEESAMRQVAIDAASIPKDAKIAVLEKNSAESEKKIAEARSDKLKQLAEMQQFQRKMADMETKIKSLESTMAEKNALIKVLQKRSLDKGEIVDNVLSIPIHDSLSAASNIILHSKQMSTSQLGGSPLSQLAVSHASQLSTPLPLSVSQLSTNLPLSSGQLTANLPISSSQLSANLPMSSSQLSSNMPISSGHVGQAATSGLSLSSNSTPIGPSHASQHSAPVPLAISHASQLSTPLPLSSPRVLDFYDGISTNMSSTARSRALAAAGLGGLGHHHHYHSAHHSLGPSSVTASRASPAHHLIGRGSPAHHLVAGRTEGRGSPAHHLVGGRTEGRGSPAHHLVGVGAGRTDGRGSPVHPLASGSGGVAGRSSPAHQRSATPSDILRSATPTRVELSGVGKGSRRDSAHSGGGGDSFPSSPPHITDSPNKTLINTSELYGPGGGAVSTASGTLPKMSFTPMKEEMARTLPSKGVSVLRTSGYQFISDSKSNQTSPHKQGGSLGSPSKTRLGGGYQPHGSGDAGDDSSYVTPTSPTDSASTTGERGSSAATTIDLGSGQTSPKAGSANGDRAAGGGRLSSYHESNLGGGAGTGGEMRAARAGSEPATSRSEDALSGSPLISKDSLMMALKQERERRPENYWRV